MLREYVYFDGRVVGMLSAQLPGKVLRVHADPLGTPRAVSDGPLVLWCWDGDAFGDMLPNEDVDGNGQSLTMPLRMPGQYFDREVGLFYNYFRDYDPATGRYVESDPIGLQGGMNTYGYVGGNVFGAVDPRGLKYCDKSCKEIKEKVRKILESTFLKYRKIKCTLNCGNLLLGGQGATNLLTGNITLNYNEISVNEGLAFTTTIAHELLHCKEGYGLSHWGASDPSSLFYNPYQGRLDDTAYNDAYTVSEQVRKLFRCKDCE